MQRVLQVPQFMPVSHASRLTQCDDDVLLCGRLHRDVNSQHVPTVYRSINLWYWRGEMLEMYCLWLRKREDL
jgi:hypothetical protein